MKKSLAMTTTMIDSPQARSEARWNNLNTRLTPKLANWWQVAKGE
jgi:hypothetical protein